jgi:hypothetical protein
VKAAEFLEYIKTTSFIQDLFKESIIYCIWDGGGGGVVGAAMLYNPSTAGGS